MSFRARRSGALVLALAIPFLASVPGPERDRGAVRPTWPRLTLPACSDVAYVVGDSRRTLEHAVLPGTTDRIWADLLGMPGGEPVDGMRHVRYLARPGAVHEWYTDDLAALMDGCSHRRRPLVFDFMGSNYAIAHPEQTGDPSFYRDIRTTIETFYETAAPDARVVLAELTFDRTAGDAAQQAGAADYLDRYNDVLRDLARTKPWRYFFLPAPAVYDGTVVWRDAAHETTELAYAEYTGGAPTGALDAAGVALLTGRRGGVCALVADERFGPDVYSEGVSLIAYLQDFRRSRAADRWLGRTPAATRTGPLRPDERACTF